MTAPEVRLRIAEVNIVVRTQAEAVRLAPELERFRLPGAAEVAPDLTLELADGPAPPPQGLKARRDGDATLAKRTSDGFWFRRLNSCLFANSDFSSCRAWRTEQGRPYREPFDGRPWLMLALWGYLSQRNGAMLHGAVCVLSGRFVTLLGDQQVGKSTLSRLVVAAGHTCLTDEYPVLTWTDEAAWAHGTPWPGVAGPVRELSGPLDAILFVGPAPENVVRPLSAREAGRRLLRNARFFLWDPDRTPLLIELLDRTARSVPAYDFGFVPSPDAVKVLAEALAARSSAPER